ncbi:class I SAM-dependent methyltransferase [Bacteroidota bacterium]
MILHDIIKETTKPEIYTKGSAVMWTDEHISKQLLDVHLNPDVDLASRKQTTIEKTVNWILEKAPGEKMNILDLGCGPGLYAELLNRRGHNITGIDFSRLSIEYAQQQSEKKNLGITYLHQNYLDLNEDSKYDLVILIYTDLGVLFPEDRKILLNKIYKALKPGGLFVFDLLNDKEIEKKVHPKNWELVHKGFWKDEPYLALSDSFLYPEKKVILYQHVIIDENDNQDVYRFWTHYFANDDVTNMLNENGFSNISCYEDVLPEGDFWGGNNVTFCVAQKK